jgi:hypothetical protein
MGHFGPSKCLRKFSRKVDQTLARLCIKVRLSDWRIVRRLADRSCPSIATALVFRAQNGIYATSTWIEVPLPFARNDLSVDRRPSEGDPGHGRLTETSRRLGLAQIYRRAAMSNDALDAASSGGDSRRR